MCGAVIGLLAETSIHPGTGRSTGVVDLPSPGKRRRLSFIAGSSLKAHCDQARQHTNNNENFEKEIFGAPDEAGALLVSNASSCSGSVAHRRLPLGIVNSSLKGTKEAGGLGWGLCPRFHGRAAVRSLRRGGAPFLEERSSG